MEGRGAFGEVYRVTHLQLNVPLAIKVLSRAAPGIGSNDYQEAQMRFQFEARLGTQLNTPNPQPNILMMHDFNNAEDVLVLEMEYAPGGSLAELLEQAKNSSKPLPLEIALQHALEIATGLSVLHAHDIIHRDLKPTNILFDNGLHAKIADLGLAQIPGGGPSQRSKFSAPTPHPCTPGYMSRNRSILAIT